jgi:hypothetical protein
MRTHLCLLVRRGGWGRGWGGGCARSPAPLLLALQGRPASGMSHQQIISFIGPKTKRRPWPFKVEHLNFPSVSFFVLGPVRYAIFDPVFVYFGLNLKIQKSNKTGFPKFQTKNVIPDSHTVISLPRACSALDLSFGVFRRRDEDKHLTGRNRRNPSISITARPHQWRRPRPFGGLLTVQ